MKCSLGSSGTPVNLFSKETHLHAFLQSHHSLALKFARQTGPKKCPHSTKSNHQILGSYHMLIIMQRKVGGHSRFARSYMSILHLFLGGRQRSHTKTAPTSYLFPQIYMSMLHLSYRPPRPYHNKPPQSETRSSGPPRPETRLQRKNPLQGLYGRGKSKLCTHMAKRTLTVNDFKLNPWGLSDRTWQGDTFIMERLVGNGVRDVGNRGPLRLIPS